MVVIQARMSSSRLPGKSLADVEGEPMLALLVRRLAPAETVARIVVATSDGAEDDPIASEAERLGAGLHRGPRDDVLARFAGAIEGHDGPVVRITGDCPLTDPAIVDRAVRLLAGTPGCVYVQNVEPRTYPDGLDVEVVQAATLRELAGTATAPADREHVTTAVRADPQRFPAAVLPGPSELAEVRWTVDNPDDLEFVREVAARLGERRHHAGMDEILDAVRAEPSLAEHGGARRA
jgi:spore coat polysaccharide biosynthesis protein SpsF (cytidylyltransferase family)